jgi:hypothetical protein
MGRSSVISGTPPTQTPHSSETPAIDKCDAGDDDDDDDDDDDENDTQADNASNIANAAAVSINALNLTLMCFPPQTVWTERSSRTSDRVFVLMHHAPPYKDNEYLFGTSEVIYTSCRKTSQKSIIVNPLNVHRTCT